MVWKVGGCCAPVGDIRRPDLAVLKLPVEHPSITHRRPRCGEHVVRQRSGRWRPRRTACDRAGSSFREPTMHATGRQSFAGLTAPRSITNATAPSRPRCTEWCSNAPPSTSPTRTFRKTPKASTGLSYCSPRHSRLSCRTKALGSIGFDGRKRRSRRGLTLTIPRPPPVNRGVLLLGVTTGSPSQGAAPPPVG